MNFNKSMVYSLILMFQFSMAAPLDIDKDKQAGSLAMPGDITDRAAGTHNASNIGLFFENRGKLYPRRLSDGPSGEFPINSGRHYIYRINPMVGIAPDANTGRGSNVIQGRYIQNEEWEAVGGYHNPDIAAIAFSDQPATWPASSWHLQDDDGNPIIRSSQDSYCVYNDANNTVEVLGIQVAQTGYAWGLSYAEDLLFFTFDLTNSSSTTYDSVYFALYVDFDIGNISGGDPEYTDDLIGFDLANNFVTTYDATHTSAEWGGATGIMGVTFLETPSIDGEMAGITDMHYNLYDNDVDDDGLQMTILSSNLDYLPDNFRAEDYTHPGSGGNPHYDDVGLIDPDGEDLVVTVASGPFDLSPGDTLRFITCIVAGVDEADLYRNLGVAQDLYAQDFTTPKPPVTPILSAAAGSNEVTLYWTNAIEGIADEISNALDFEGYNLYRSLDRGINWDQVDRNFYPEVGPDAVPLASFDRVNGIGDDAGIQYSYTDETVINGFEYWYSLTAFDQGDSLIESLESAIGNTTESLNTISIIPHSTPAAYLLPDIAEIRQIGDGHSNYNLEVFPLTSTQLSTYSYELSFEYLSRPEIGNTGAIALAVILDSSATVSDHYGIEFIPDDKFNLHNLSTGEVIREGYPFRTGVQFNLASGLKVEFLITDTLNTPSPGDYLSLNFCSTLKRFDGADSSTVLNTQRFDPGIQLVSDDGLLFTMEAQPEIQDISIPPILNFDVAIDVSDADALLDSSYLIQITGSGSDEDGIAYISVEVMRDDLSPVMSVDTLYDDGSITFNGISAGFDYDPSNPPPEGTSVTFTSVPAVVPNIQDVFQFGIVDGMTDDAMLEEALADIKVVPNPYVVGSLWETEFGELRREPLRQIQFTNLPMSCEIIIFTLAGDLIKTLRHESASGTETWDLRAEGGREIAAGIYLYHVSAGEFEYFNRFAVIK